jgi:type I restriction enzyme M protein
MLGDAYEYLIKQFADDAGKKGGEFYTPKGVVQLVVALLDPQPSMSVYDPTCGSGGMLVESANHIAKLPGPYWAGNQYQLSCKCEEKVGKVGQSIQQQRPDCHPSLSCLNTQPASSQ